MTNDATRCAHHGCTAATTIHTPETCWCAEHAPTRAAFADSFADAPEPTDEVRAQWAKQHQEWLRKNAEAVRATYPTRRTRRRAG